MILKNASAVEAKVLWTIIVTGRDNLVESMGLQYRFTLILTMIVHKIKQGGDISIL
jgi:hypothetical protein